jgi:hypothetical protein
LTRPSSERSPPSCFPGSEKEDDGLLVWVPLASGIPNWYARLGFGGLASQAG